MKLSPVSSLAIASALVLASSPIVIPPTPYDGPTIAQYTASSYEIDAPKVSNINSTALGEFWYFDAVSSQRPDYSLLLSFSASTTQVYNQDPTPNPGSILSVRVIVRAGGNVFAETVWADSAELYTMGIGTSGFWKGTGCSFSASKDLSMMEIELHTPQGITGSVVLQSNVPPHFPCSLNEIGGNLVLTPGLGWVNPVLEAEAHVDLRINDTIIQFKGHGYHDMTWGNVPFSEVQASLFFAHAKIGPFAFVIYVQILPGGGQTSSSFVSKDEQALAVSCSGLKVDIGFDQMNSTTGPVKSVMVEIAIESGVFEAFLTVSDILFSSGSTYHGNGIVHGGVRSEGRKYSGIATFEYVQPLPPSFQT